MPDETTDRGRPIDAYDALLGAIPLPLAAGALAGASEFTAASLGVLGGSVVAAAVVWVAVFGVPPGHDGFV